MRRNAWLAVFAVMIWVAMPLAHAQGACVVDGTTVVRIVPPPNNGDNITTSDFYLTYEFNGLWLKQMIDQGHLIQITTQQYADLEGDRCVGGNLDSAQVDPQKIYFTRVSDVSNPYGTFVRRVWYEHVEKYNASTGCYTSGEHVFTIYVLVDGVTKCSTQYQFVAHSPSVQASVTWTSPAPNSVLKYPSPSNSADVHLVTNINVTQGASGKICVIWQKEEGGMWVDKSVQASFYAQAGQYPIDTTTSLRSITPDWEGVWRVAVFYTPSTSCTDSSRVLISADPFTATVNYSQYTPPPSTCGSYTWSAPQHGDTYTDGGSVGISISIDGDAFDYLGEPRYAFKLIIESNASGNWSPVQEYTIEKQYSWQSSVLFTQNISLPVGSYRARLVKFPTTDPSATVACESRYFDVVHVEDINYNWIEPVAGGNYEFNADQNTYFPFKITGDYVLSSGYLCWRYQEITDTSWTIYPQNFTGSGSFNIEDNIYVPPGTYIMDFYTSQDGCATPSRIIEERTFTVTVVPPPEVPPPPPEVNVPAETNETNAPPPAITLPDIDQGESSITGYAIFNKNTLWYLAGLWASGWMAMVDVPAALATFAVWNYAGIRAQMLSSAEWEMVALPLVLAVIVIARRLTASLGW